jgi:hypothetical protein
MMVERSPQTRLDALLDQLATDLEPVKPLDDRPTLLLLSTLLLLAGLLVLTWLGARPDLIVMQPQPMFLLRCGTLLVLAVVCVAAVVTQAHPGVGRNSQGWKVAAVMAALFPLVGAAMAVVDPAQAKAMMAMPTGWQCLRMSLMTGTLCAVPMVLHLRRGAPVAPERAGLLVGLASGSLGALAYNLHCPFDSVVYIGLWYGVAIAVATVAGRLVVPRLIRW